MKPKRRQPRARRMILPSREGLIEVRIRGDERKSLIARYDNAVRKFIYTGDASGLRRFRGKTVRTETGDVEFLTDLNALERLAFRGELSFESIYARVG